MESRESLAKHSLKQCGLHSSQYDGMNTARAHFCSAKQVAKVLNISKKVILSVTLPYKNYQCAVT
jgi:hypothetical protein